MRGCRRAQTALQLDLQSPANAPVPARSSAFRLPLSTLLLQVLCWHFCACVTLLFLLYPVLQRIFQKYVSSLFSFFKEEEVPQVKQAIAIRIHACCWWLNEGQWRKIEACADHQRRESSSRLVCPRVFEYKSRWQTDVRWQRGHQWKCVLLLVINEHLFPALKAALWRHHFLNNAEVEQAVQLFFES